MTPLTAEGIAPEVRERAYRMSLARPSGLISEDDLTALCHACDERGWYRRYWNHDDGAVETGRCRHFNGLLQLILESEGLPTETTS